MDIINYKKEYDIDAYLVSQGASIDALKQSLGFIKSFVEFSKTLDSDVKDAVLQKAYDDGNDVIKDFTELKELLGEFINVDRNIS